MPRLERLLDREPREVVAELDCARALSEHPRRERLFERVDVLAGERLEQPQLRARWGDRHRVEQGARAAAQPGSPGKHRVAHRRRNCAVVAREHLGDEERIPAGQPVELDRVDLARRGQLGDGTLRERRHGQPLDLCACCELADHDPKRMGAVELVVAVGGDHEQRELPDPARQQPQRVERRLVRPVDVLEDDDRRLTGCDQPEQRPDDLGGPAIERRLQLIGLLGDVEERPERPGREEGVAAAPQHARSAGRVAEATDGDGLADPGLARDEHEAPAARARLVQPFAQPG